MELSIIGAALRYFLVSSKPLSVPPENTPLSLCLLQVKKRGFLDRPFTSKQLPKDQLSKIEAMINLDTLGLGPNEGLGQPVGFATRKWTRGRLPIR